MKKDHIKELYTKYIKGELSAEEQKQFFDYIQTNAADSELMDIMAEEEWEAVGEDEVSQVDEEVFKRVEARLRDEILKKDEVDKR